MDTLVSDETSTSDLETRIAGGELISGSISIFSFDTKFLYCPSGAVIKVFNVATGRYCGQLQGHTDRITGLLMNERNHLQLVSCSLDGFLVTWDIGTEYAAIKTLAVNRPVYKVAQLKCYSNSYLLVLGTTAASRYFVVDSNSCSEKENGDTPSLFSFDRLDASSFSSAYETNIIATIDGPRRALVWCAESSRIVKIALPNPSESFAGIATHPTDRNVLAISTDLGRIYLWTKVFANSDGVAGPAAFHLHWHSLPLRAIAFSPEGTFLFSAGSECVLVKWIWRKQQRSFLPRIGSPVSSIALSPDGSAYALSLVDNTIALVSSNMILTRFIRGFISGGRIPARRPVMDGISTMCVNISPAGLIFDHRLHALITNGRPGHLQFFDADGNRNLLLLDVASENYVSGKSLLPVTEVIKAEMSSDGYWLATAQTRGDMKGECTLKIWHFEAETTKTFCVNTLVPRAHSQAVTAVRFFNGTENTQKRLISTSLDGMFRLWRCRKQESVCPQPGYSPVYQWQNTFTSSHHSLPLYDADWSSDGSLCALAAGPYILLVDGNIDGEDADAEGSSDGDWLLSTLTVDTNSRIASVRFGRQDDVAYLIACSLDGEGFVSIWNLATLQMTWKTDFVLPLIVTDPSTSYVLVLSGAALPQKQLMFFKPSAPTNATHTNFELPLACANSQVNSPVVAATFTPKNLPTSTVVTDCNEPLQQNDLYVLTADQTLYAVSMQSKQPTVQISNESPGKAQFYFSSQSFATKGGLPQSSLATFLSAGIAQDPRKTGTADKDKSHAMISESDSLFKFDSLFETPPHLLPPIGRLSAEFLLRQCAESCGLASNVDSRKQAADNKKMEIDTEEINEKAANLRLDPNTSATPSTSSDFSARTDTSWLREVIM